MNSFASTKQDANKSSRSTSVAVANDAAHAEGQFIDNRDEPVSLARLQKANPNTPAQRAAVSRPLQLASGKAEEVAPIFEEDEATPMTSEELADVKGPKGEGAQIDRGKAELTRTARVKGVFGNESTYSKFLSKVDQFNASQDVIKKQKSLLNLDHWPDYGSKNIRKMWRVTS